MLKREKAPETMRRVVSAFLLLLGASACGIPTVGGSAVRNCHATSDCPSGESCLYSVFNSCGMPGTCLPNDGTACFNQTACACDGTTQTVCLSNGNSPAPVDFLGSCDGATQQGYDVNLPPTPDATLPPVDATPPEDAGPDTTAPPVDAGQIADTGEEIDSADAAPSSTYGSPCNRNSDCTDPVYNQCGLNNTCTKTCTHNSQCPVPPTLGTCNLLIDLCD